MRPLIGTFPTNQGTAADGIVTDSQGIPGFCHTRVLPGFCSAICNFGVHFGDNNILPFNPNQLSFFRAGFAHKRVFATHSNNIVTFGFGFTPIGLMAVDVTLLRNRIGICEAIVKTP
jgi:hypothetical protein